MEIETVPTDQILRAIFGLSKKQLECFQQLRSLENDGTCITYLYHLMNSERSIVQKQLSVLLKKGLVQRKSVTLAEFQEKCIKLMRPAEIIPQTNKGYLYIYTPISNEELFDKMDITLNNWKELMKEYLNP